MILIVNSFRSIDYNGRSYMPGDKVEMSPGASADRLLDKGVCKIYDDGIIAKTPALESMTVAELKKFLDDLAVVYDSRLRKDELISLINANTAEPSTVRL